MNIGKMFKRDVENKMTGMKKIHGDLKGGEEDMDL